MRFLKIISTFSILLLLISFKLFTNAVSITGHIRIDSNKVDLCVNHLLVSVKSGHRIFASTHADKNGDFYLTFTPKKEKNFKFYCSAPSIGTMLLKTVTRFESDTPEMTFFIPPKK